MTKSQSTQVNGERWYKVKIADEHSRIYSYPVARVTPSSVTYLEERGDEALHPGWAKFRANKVRKVVLDGVNYWERKEKVSCTKHHWFSTAFQAEQFLKQYFHDKIKHHEEILNEYRELLQELLVQ